MDNNRIPCSERRFVAKLENIYTTNYWWYLQTLKYLLHRLGKDATLALWDAAFKNYNAEHIANVLIDGWQESVSIEHKGKVNNYVSTFFTNPIEEMTASQAKILVETTPPFPQISSVLPCMNMEKETTAFTIMPLLFDAQAVLAEKTIDLYGKQGELIIYDAITEGRSIMAQYNRVSFKEFVQEYCDSLKPKIPNIFSAGLDIQIINRTNTELVVHVTQCEWARYYNTYHPKVGYLLACSTDDTFALARAPDARMQRTSTIMEGGKFCDFRYYILLQQKYRQQYKKHS